MKMALSTPNTFNPEMEVEVSEGFAGPKASEMSYESDHRLSFDDFSTWEPLFFSDREMMITARGEDVHHEQGSHMILDAMDREQPQRVVMHESWVNYWLDSRNIIMPMVSGGDR